MTRAGPYGKLHSIGWQRKGNANDASGNAAALIGGVTLHSATNIGFEGKNEVARNISEEKKLRWKNMTMLIVNEISQVGGLTLAAVDSRLRQYRDDQHRPFDGIAIVMICGDFF